MIGSRSGVVAGHTARLTCFFGLEGERPVSNCFSRFDAERSSTLPPNRAFPSPASLFPSPVPRSPPTAWKRAPFSLLLLLVSIFCPCYFSHSQRLFHIFIFLCLLIFYSLLTVFVVVLPNPGVGSWSSISPVVCLSVSSFYVLLVG